MNLTSDFPGLATIVVAAGHGCITPGTPKLLEPVDDEGTPMIVRVIRTVMEARIGPIYLVVSRRFGHLISEAVTRAFGDMPNIHLVYQGKRAGAGDAIRIAMDEADPSINTFAVIYGDMPLWRSETLRALVEEDQGTAALMSMVTVARGFGAPEALERYGRVQRVKDGIDITYVVEPAQATPAELEATHVNPSLYVFFRRWFLENITRVQPVWRPDGFGAEVHVPPLVGILTKVGGLITEVRLRDPQEALGVNSAAELELIREILRGRDAAARNI